MKMHECPRFGDCSAPICPLSKKSINNSSWMIGEEICHNTKIRKNKNWIIKQKRLNNKIKNNFYNHGFFTVEMLEHLKNITFKTCGLQDITKKSMYRTWIYNHPITTKSIKQIARDLQLAQTGAEKLLRYRLYAKKI